MTKTQRVKSAVSFNQAGKPVVIPQILAHSAVLSNVPIKEYLTSGKTLAKCQLNALKQYDHDGLFAFFDLGLEAEALGTKLFYPDRDYPNIKRYVIQDASDITLLTLPKINDAGRTPELLEAIKIMKAEVGSQVPIIGIFSGPMTILTQIMGMEKALFLAVDELDTFLTLLDFTTSFAVELARLMIHAGVSVPVLFDPSDSPEIIPPQFFREFVQPKIREILLETKKAGCLFNWLNITGDITTIFPFVNIPEVDILNIDYSVDPEIAAEKIQQTCIDGNIKPLSFQEESEQFIFDKAKRLLKLFQRRKGFILSSGCEIPFDSKPENVKAMVKAASSWE